MKQFSARLDFHASEFSSSRFRFTDSQAKVFINARGKAGIVFDAVHTAISCSAFGSQWWRIDLLQEAYATSADPPLQYLKQSFCRWLAAIELAKQQQQLYQHSQ